MALVADTTVLIDLWRLRKEPHRLVNLRALLIDPCLPLPVLFEFARGAAFRGVDRRKLDRFLAGFEILIPSYHEVIQAANLDADLRKAGREIGGSDVWIATAARERKLPVLTGNVDHFTRIDGLTVMGYQILP
jgi:tRNA(fMet)-specific endonuclease VapC